MMGTTTIKFRSNLATTTVGVYVQNDGDYDGGPHVAALVYFVGVYVQNDGDYDALQYYL